MQENRPKVGIGVLFFHKGTILLGKRIGKHGEHSYGPPGGHLEYGETPEQCTMRETLEETGLSIANITFAGITNDIFQGTNKHYISIFMQAEFPVGQEIENPEPDKTESWNWYSLKDLPSPLFQPLQDWLSGNTYGKTAK